MLPPDNAGILQKETNLKVGDIVMEKADDLPRNEWKLAKVVETVTDKDGTCEKRKDLYRRPEDGKGGTAVWQEVHF